MVAYCKNCLKCKDGFCELYKENLEKSKLGEYIKLSRCKSKVKPKIVKPKTVPKAKRLSKLRKECDKLWSEAVRARDGNKCVLCGSASHCQAHHWCHTKAQGNATRWDISNGITLCYTCHLYKVHSGAAYYMDMAKNTAIRIIGQKAYEDLVTPKEPRVFNESEMIDIKNHLTDLKNSVE